MSNKTNVLLCGGGNAIHVLSAYVSSRANCQVQVLSLFPGEADRLRAALPEQGVSCQHDLANSPTVGKPSLVTDQPSQVADADVVLLAIPSFTHQLYLEALKPFLKKGVVLGAMPGEGGFDICASYVLGDDFCATANLFALETLPWACRIVEYGKSVEVLGTKKEIDVVITPAKGQELTSTLNLLQMLVGEFPKLNPAGNFLAVTLMNINSVWHPTISYGFYRNKDVTKPMDEPPLFYQGADEYTGEMLSKISDEVLALGKALQDKYPGLSMKGLHHVRDWMLTSYGDDIGDKTNVYTMLLTNKGYRGLTHPTVTAEVDGATKYLPNFKYRYFTEDIPCGLMVTRGIAALAGVATPNMDEVIYWSQKVMNKEYLAADGTLTGKDLAETRCPQRFGITDLDTLMKKNRYV